ncbi:MAG: exopolyphosphatase, partial [Shinella sp. 65-6]
SLELVDVAGAMIGRGITLPLGGIRLSEASGGSTAQARIVARKYLRTANLLKNGTGRAFYAVGGTWRAIGALHMEVQNYPLHMIQGYELGFADAMDFLTDIVTAKDQKDAAYAAISKGRRNLLPFGAVALQETIALMKPSRVFFSAQGVREGFLYSLLPDREKGRDPLLAAAGELAILRARSPEHARELAEWTGRMMPFFGITETEEERRYREAACLLADISWRAHPDYRGLQALNLIAHGTFIGITHPGRAFIALTNYYRFEGLNDDAVSSSLAAIATPRLRELAKLVGALLRIVYPFSASMPGVVPHLSIRKSSAPDTDLEFVVPADFSELAGERLDGRLQQLAKLTGRKLAFRFL